MVGLNVLLLELVKLDPSQRMCSLCFLPRGGGNLQGTLLLPFTFTCGEGST